MRNVITLTAAAASAAVIGLVGATPASAEATTTSFGSAQQITDRDVISSYTVSMPTPSSDAINVPIAGKLYASKVTVKAVQGAVTPAIPFFNARTSSGENYRVLFQANTPESLSGATLQQGDSSTGSIYFDVTGPAPTSVAYNDAVQDRAIWQGGGSTAAPAATPSDTSSGPAMSNPDSSSSNSGSSNSGAAEGARSAG